MSQENREEIFNSGRRRNYKILIVSLALIIVGTTAGIYLLGIQRFEAKSPQAGVKYNLPSNPVRIQYTVEGNSLILSSAEVQSNRYVILDYVQTGETIPMMAYVAPSGRTVTAIRLCEPCESKSFWFDTDQAVCSACGTRWYAETLKGISGACTEYPPTEVKNTISGDSLTISLSDIQALKTQTKTSDTVTDAKSAVRLIVVVPSAITQGQVTPIKIKAIDENGKVDPQRDDVVKASIGQGYAMLRDPTAENKKWTREVTVKLSGGVATVEILDEIIEVSKLSAVWVSGQSYLQPTSSGVICIGQH